MTIISRRKMLQTTAQAVASATVVAWAPQHAFSKDPTAEPKVRTVLGPIAHDTLAADEGPGAIVEATPIRVGRYPELLVDLARRTKVHVIASSGFWCEAV